ncbi:MAG: SPOR domain-containing protein [Candidatus Omnitrophica bacterium]|nr:SPOR domain-containing protein [Candidatus Omnitrophota bacterium]
MDFPGEKRPARFQLPVFAGRFLRIRVAYEDLIFGTLALALVLLAGFCLGVERGKRVGVGPMLADQGVGTASAQAPRERPELSAGAAAGPASAGRAARAAEQPLPVIRVSTPVVTGSAVSRSEARDLAEGAHVIQLASYNGERTAREEAARLSKRGVRAQVIPQGRYHELRAVGFRTRAEAKAALALLSKTYRDAFIKRLSP